MKDQDFDKIIGDKLREYSKQPPAELFSRIEKSLAEGNANIAEQPVKHRRMASAWKYAGIAALFCALLATSLYLRDSYRTVPESRMAKTNVTTTNITTTEAQQPIQQTHPEAGLHINEPAQQKSIITDKRPDDTTTEAVAANISQQTHTTPSTLADTVIRVEAVKENPRRPYRQNNSNMRQRVDEYWDNMLAAETPAKHRNKTSISIFAGNAGASGGGTHTTNPDKAVSSGMLLQEQPDNGYDRPMSGLSEDGNSQSSAVPFTSKTKDVNLKHYMPLNVGLGVSIPLTSAIALNTGVNYSYLFSSSTQTFSTNTEGRTTRELHYVGIPLGVSYKFLSKKGFNLYVYGGGIIEKAVAWRETHFFSSRVDNGKEVMNRNVKGVQLSVNASAGASYDLTKNLSVYLEPGIAYYFLQKDQPASYRTVNPTSFSLRLGLRFGI